MRIIKSEKSYEAVDDAIFVHHCYVVESRFRIAAWIRICAVRLAVAFAGAHLKREAAVSGSGYHVLVDRYGPHVHRTDVGWIGYWRGSSGRVNVDGGRKGEVLQ